MKDMKKYAVEDDELDIISGGTGSKRKGDPYAYLRDSYRINGYNYKEAAEYINEYKRLKTVDDAIRFANNKIFRSPGWDRLRTEDALAVCDSLYYDYCRNN